MGNLASSNGQNNFESAWKLVGKSAENWHPPGHQVPQTLAESRPVRVYVSSTFRDFENERHFLHTEIFPEIERWCQMQKIRFIPMDVWREVPTENDKFHIIQAVFGALDKCYEDSNDGQPLLSAFISNFFY